MKHANSEKPCDLCLGGEKDSYSREVEKAIRYMEKNFQYIDSISEIASHVDMNYHTLRDRFRRETKICMKEFLICVRVQHALFLLNNKNMLIKEIAWSVGFWHEKQLSRTFQKLFNRSPRALRAVGVAK
jgi:transcriptional regulator GlxA family with amidase domain